MALSPLAGKPAPDDLLVDLARLEAAYFHTRPDPADPAQRVQFGTSGHRGTPLAGSFTEAHILAITQAICEYRRGQGIDGPLFMGKDTHALSAPAQRTALEVLAANERRDDHPARRRRDAHAGHLARHPGAQPRPQRAASPTASSSRPRTIRRRTAASNTIRPTAARRIPTSRGGCRTAPTRCCAAATARSSGMPLARPRSTADTTLRRISSVPTWTICATSSTWTPSAAAGLQAGRRSARRRRAALLASRSTNLWARHHRGERQRRPDVLVHAGGP